MKFSVFTLLLFLFAFVGCDNFQDVSINGRIDHNVYEDIKSRNLNNVRIGVWSGGGDVFAASRLGEYLLHKDVSIIVTGECLSSCAEFILPAAKNIAFNKSPLIGFHWSPIMDHGEYERAGADMEVCKFPSLKVQKTILNYRDLEADFWMEVEQRLGLEEFEFVNKGSDCPWKTRSFLNHIWLPTSQQLKDLWGLQFNGKVCADDFHNCKKQINRRWETGTRVVVGDVVYISKRM